MWSNFSNCDKLWQKKNRSIVKKNTLRDNAGRYYPYFKEDKLRCHIQYCGLMISRNKYYSLSSTSASTDTKESTWEAAKHVFTNL